MDLIHSIFFLILIGVVIFLWFKIDSLKKRFHETVGELSLKNKEFADLKEQYKRDIGEWKEKERKRILRDINLVIGNTNSDNLDLVEAVIIYSNDCFLSAKSMHDIEKQLDAVIQAAAYDSYVNEYIRPILNETDFLFYKGLLDLEKNVVMLHSDLDPRDIISQVCFFNERGWTKNQGVLLDLISEHYGGAMKEFTNSFHGFESFLYEEEVERILNFYIKNFNLEIADASVDEVIYGHEASYSRSPSGLAKIFSRALFESMQVKPHLNVLEEERFCKIVDLFFFGIVAYDIMEFHLYIDRIIDNVLVKRKTNDQLTPEDAP